MDLSNVKDISIIVAGVVAFVGLFSSYLEYRRRGRQERGQHFIEMRRRFLEDPSFREILNLLATDDPKLNQVSVQERRNFIGFFEEIALMVNSKLLSTDVAFYMFGHYVCLANSSIHLWEGLDPKSRYWAVFRQFAELIECHAKEKAVPEKLRF